MLQSPHLALAIITIIAMSRVPHAKARPDPLVITRMPDGVTVSGSQPLRQMVASWDVFVTLDPPTYPQQLADQLDKLDHAFQAVQERGFEIEVQKLRRDHMRQALHVDSVHGRKRRGLLDIGGTILHSLFGVATNAQLTRFRNALYEVAHNQDSMAHANQQLATVLNQTRSYLKTVALSQQRVSDRMTKLHRILHAVARRQRNMDDRLGKLELTSALDHYLDILAVSITQYTSQVALFTRQRASLELGHLSRDLLSPHQLSDILTQAATAHHVVSNLEWYYSHVSVQPLWRHTGQLLYRIELPLISSRPYLLYTIAAYPVPITNSTLSVALNLEPKYALDTVSGNIFIPTQCLGNRPVICNTGAEYGPSLLKCARGLINSRADLIKSCTVNIRDYAGLPQVATMALNQYAIATQGETLVVRCPGSPESHIPLARGAYNITCLDHCTLQGEGYSITCVDRLFLERHIMPTAVRATANFNFSRALKVETLRDVLPQLSDLDTSPIDSLPVNWLLNPPSPSQLPPIRSHPSILAVINVATIFFIVLAITIIYWRHCLTRCRSNKIIQSTIQPQEILPLTSANPVTEPQSTITPCVWPKLPNVTDCYAPNQLNCPS